MPSTDHPAAPPAQAEPTHGDRPEAGDGHTDEGLLTPVRAGTGVERATSDAAYLRAMLDTEAALTRAQASLGLAPPTAAEAVTAATREPFDVRALALDAHAGGNPVIPLVRALTDAVATRDPGAAAYVHRGATSQDVLDTATMLVASRALAAVLDDLDRTATALADLAAAHRDTPMAGRTLTQHAVPTTFGLRAAGWRSLVLDARERLAAVRAGLPAQLGGAAGTLAAFHAFAEDAHTAPRDDPGPALLAAFAHESGLCEPLLPWHTLRTPVADLAGALAFTAGALGKPAADVLVLCRTEIGELAEAAGGGSSAMPHKTNPVRATLMAAAARQVPALASVLYGALAAEDDRPAGAWHAEWQPLREALRLTGGAAAAAAELAGGLRVDASRMHRNLGATGGLVVTERLTAVLAARLGRGPARRIVEGAARRVSDDGTDLVTALGDEPLLDGALRAGELHDLLRPSGYTGSAGALVDRALSRGARPA